MYIYSIFIFIQPKTKGNDRILFTKKNFQDSIFFNYLWRSFFLSKKQSYQPPVTIFSASPYDPLKPVLSNPVYSDGGNSFSPMISNTAIHPPASRTTRRYSGRYNISVDYFSAITDITQDIFY